MQTHGSIYIYIYMQRTILVSTHKTIKTSLYSYYLEYCVKRAEVRIGGSQTGRSVSTRQSQ